MRDLIEKDAEKQDTNHHQFNNAYQSSPDQLQHATWSNNINGTTSAIVSNIDSTDRQSTPIDGNNVYHPALGMVQWLLRQASKHKKRAFRNGLLKK